VVTRSFRPLLMQGVEAFFDFIIYK